MTIVRPSVDVMSRITNDEKDYDPTIVVHFIHDINFYIKLILFGGLSIDMHMYKDEENNIVFIPPSWATESQLKKLMDTSNEVVLSTREEYELYSWKQICSVTEELYNVLSYKEVCLPYADMAAKDIIVSGKRSRLVDFIISNLERSCSENDIETIELLNNTFKRITKEEIQ